MTVLAKKRKLLEGRWQETIRWFNFPDFLILTREFYYRH